MEEVDVLAADKIHGIRRDLSRREIIIDGKAFIEIRYEVDFGPKNGCAKVQVLDPCVTEEAQQRRREMLVEKCQDYIRRGLI